MIQKQVLHIRGLKKNFGKFHALHGIDMDLDPGEVLGFIGPNGAGKSTTIRTILGLIKPSQGDVRVFGADAWREAVSIHQHLAYVPGDVYLWPNLTGGQTIDLLLRLANQKHSQRTDELIQKFDVDISKKNRTYSKGNRQKIALIAALSADVPFYLFDEPTSGLDPLNEVIFQSEVADLKAQGKSILLSSHILSEVEKIGDKIAIIRAGEIIESGSLAQMRHLTRSQITVTTRHSLQALVQQKNIHRLELSGNHQQSAQFNVDTDQIQQVMTELAQYQILDLKVTPPTLEDLFLRYYNDDRAKDEVSL